MRVLRGELAVAVPTEGDIDTQDRASSLCGGHVLITHGSPD
jgi:hypothetical protein